MTTSHIRSAGQFLKANWHIVAIMVLATWLRTWHLESKAIFFGDAAYDLWSASQAVQQRQVPLLGIASSVPRFKQGPVTVWLEMAIFTAAGFRLLPYLLLFAGLSLAAVIALYELVVTQINRPVALFAASWLAVSPLAVAHGRMPYHITPIPLMTGLYLYALVRLWRRQGTWRWGWATLAWAGLFQFELAVAPLWLMIPYVWWRRDRGADLKPMAIQTLTALALGLWPQIVFDVTHKFAQLGGFAVWVAYRIAGTTGVVGHDQQLGVAKFLQWWRSVALYVPRFVGLEVGWVTVVWVAMLVGAVGLVWSARSKLKVPPLVELTLVATGCLAVGFLAHGSPSEAYYPPLLVLFAILTGYAAWWFDQQWPRWTRLGWVVWLSWAGLQLFQANFLVSQPAQAFNYGPSSGEQRQLVTWFKSQGISTVYLRTTDEGGRYPSYFQNLQWLAQTQGVNIVLTPQVGVPTFFIEPLDSPLNSYPEVQRTPFESRQIVKVLGL